MKGANPIFEPVTIRYIYLSLFALFSAFSATAQCVQQVNFNNWKHTGDAQGQWVIQNGGAELTTNFNTVYPTMFVGPDTLINVRVTGSFQVTNTVDDDYLGFVFGYQSPDTTWAPGLNYNADMDFYLFDWKRANQTYFGYVAQEGFTLNEVDGIYPRAIANVFPGFWNHNSVGGFSVLATDYGTTLGWNYIQTYDFELLYTPTRALVKIDTDTIFDITGCFEPGRFGFYNFSQQYARYWNFNYELYVDFQMQAQYVCLGDPAQFSFVDTSNCTSGNVFSNISSFYWDLGDGTISNDTNPSHIYANIGTYTVNLIATDVNGCVDTNTKDIFIQGPSNPQIGYSSACLGDSLYFQDLTVPLVGSITGWQWDFGDGSPLSGQQNPVHYYSAAGTYVVEFITQNNAGCFDTTTTNVVVDDPPTPNFDFTNACKGFPNEFENSSVSAGPALTAFEWDLYNDGSVDYTGTQAVNVFPSHGSYSVQLIVYDSAGCRDSITKTVKVNPLPEPGFMGTSNCFKDDNQFTDTSSIPTGTIVSNLWLFGDGDSAANTPFTAHQFATPGTKTLTLIAYSDSGCVDSTTGSVVVYNLPTAEFQLDSVCNDRSAPFQSQSLAGYGTLTNYLWDFGDGDSAWSSGTFHDYTLPGLYTVHHTVVSDQGCRDTTSRNVRIYPLPTTTFNWTANVCEGDPLSFSEQSFVQQITPGGDFIVDWVWVLDGQDTLFGQNPDYTADTYRTIDVTLTAITNYGCEATYQNFPQIFPNPKADIFSDIDCQDYPSEFRDATAIPTGIIEEWVWDFGDGNTLINSDIVEHIYEYPGEFEVSLSVTSSRGCSDFIKKKIIVPGTPLVDFEVTPKEGCEPLEVQIKNLSTVSVGSLRYQWFVDGVEFSGLENPTLTLRTDSVVAQAFDIKLTAFSEENCQRSYGLSDVVTVIPAPRALFSLVQQDLNTFEPLATFQNSSMNSSEWDWTFGDGATSAEFNPSHVYLRSGDYDVSLIAINDFSCADTLVKRVEVAPKTTLYIPNSFTPNGDGHNEKWSPEGFNEGMPFELTVWDRWGHKLFSTNVIGDGWDGKSGDKFAQNGSYIYKIIMETPEGEIRELQGSFTLMR